MSDPTYKIAINRMKTGKLPQGDSRWGAFNDSFVNRDATLVDIADAIFTGHAYAGWHTGRRSIENFVQSQYIAVDMDTEDERSTLQAVSQHNFFQTYGSMIHTSPSHTPEKPRCRAIFLLTQPITNAAAYTAAAKFVISMFPGADTACSDASRFFYGNANCGINGIEFTDKTLPLDHLRHFYALSRKKLTPDRPAYVQELAQGERPAKTPIAKIDDFEKARIALAKIDPYSVDYNRWIGIMAAMKREFGDGALSIVETWAQGKPGEVQREWQRLKVEKSNGMHLGTILGLAQGTIH